MRSPLLLAFGLYGAACATLALRVWWHVGHGPGDDNPVGMLALLTAALAAVPTRGLTLWLGRRPVEEHLWWLFVSSVVSVPLFALTWAMIQLRLAA